MRISELSARTGVPVATIKYYLREGLLPPGEQTSATQARYDDGHVARLRLVRALLEVGGLGVAGARRLLACLDADDLHETLGRAQAELPPATSADVATQRARDLLAEVGWEVGCDTAPLRQLAVALDAVEAAGLPLGRERLARYADAADQLAHDDLAGAPDGPLEDVVAYAVLGTVLYEPVLLALRRLAHQRASAARFAGSEDGGTTGR
ncbi:MerR family transcriptional regulator [Thalassiella azotivora]